MYRAIAAADNSLSVGCGMYATVAAIASAPHASRNTRVTTIHLVAVSNAASVLAEH